MSRLRVVLILVIVLIAGGILAYAFTYSQEQEKKSAATKTGSAVTVYLKDSATETQTQQLLAEMNNISGVTKAKLISSEEAFEIYKQRNKNNPELLTNITVDIFPATIEVQVDNTIARDKVVETVKDETFVEEYIVIPNK